MKSISLTEYQEWIRVAAFFIYLKRVDQAFNHGSAETDWQQGTADINRQLLREGITIDDEV